MVFHHLVVAHAGRTRVSNKRPEMDSLFGIQCTCTCHLLRARLATAEEVTARRNLALTPTTAMAATDFKIANTKIGGTETQRIITIKRTLKDLQFYICFFPANSWQVPLAYHSFTVIIMRTVFKRCRTIIAALGKMNQN